MSCRSFPTIKILREKAEPRHPASCSLCFLCAISFCEIRKFLHTRESPLSVTWGLCRSRLKLRQCSPSASPNAGKGKSAVSFSAVRTPLFYRLKTIFIDQLNRPFLTHIQPDYSGIYFGTGVRTPLSAHLRYAAPYNKIHRYRQSSVRFRTRRCF